MEKSEKAPKSSDELKHRIPHPGRSIGFSGDPLQRRQAGKFTELVITNYPGRHILLSISQALFSSWKTGI